MESLLDISRSILIIGWAVCMVFLSVILIYIMLLLMRTNRLLKSVEHTYKQLMMLTSLPFKKIGEWLWSEEEDEEEW